MKNIHIIPTDKPSRLWTNNLRRRLELDEFPEQHPNQIAKHIYITSDEEIKEGDWFITKTNDVLKVQKPERGYDPIGKKIILTTDQDLIKDGVQAINDEFLEWFVKNPSCERVETVFACRGFNGTIPNLIPIGEYKIIIPKEEQKQHLIDIMKADEELGLYEEPKQERMYSEEDMIEFGFSTYCYISELMGVPFNLISENRLNAEEWFKNFKKK